MNSELPELHGVYLVRGGREVLAQSAAHLCQGYSAGRYPGVQGHRAAAPSSL